MRGIQYSKNTAEGDGRGLYYMEETYTLVFIRNGALT
jgi:hypothetical protein